MKKQETKKLNKILPTIRLKIIKEIQSEIDKLEELIEQNDDDFSHEGDELWEIMHDLQFLRDRI